MDKYLAIITTALVVTQIIRLVQNTISMRQYSRRVNEQLRMIDSITNEDIRIQREAYRLIVEHFEKEADDG